ncbi:hypothetical protein ACFL09_01240 [Planctomycetota bacterium]
MRRTTKRVLFWSPRVLGILFAAFISLFALDVFGEGYGFWGTILALLIHLVPTYFVVAALIIAWRWEWLGAALFIALALLYIVLFWGRLDWGVCLIIPGPLFLVGVLFLVNWVYRAKLGAR